MNKIYRIFGLWVLVLCALTVWAAPARRGWVEKQMEDGRTVRVQQMGDEWYHYWVNEQGERMEMKDERMVATGEVADEVQTAQRRAQRAPQAIGVKSLAPRGLVVLAAFSDVPYQETNDSVGMWEMMNKSGYDYEDATGSARDYFIAQSDSQYMPAFDVAGPVTLPHNRAYYGANVNNAEGKDTNPAQMIIDACKLVDDVVDFTLYDNDKDGTVDFVYVIYAGIGENDQNSVADAIWAHNSTVYYKNCVLDGKRLSNYACSGEIDGPTNKRNGIGVICHEFGHVIGLPDYYDTQYKTNFDEYLTPNYWSTMDQGCYNNGAKTPPNYSIFDKYFFGWAQPKLLAKDAQHFVRMGTGYHDAYQITGGTDLKPYTTSDTVYYIENRQLKGWDAALPGHGMLVWQVVFNQSVWTGNTPNNTAYKPRLTIVPAIAGPIGDNDGSATSNPFPGTGSVTAYTPFAGCAMSEIAESYGQIKFKFNGGKANCEYLVMSENCTVSSEEGTLSAGSALSLTILPESGYTLDPDCWAVEMGSTNPLLEYGADYTYDSATGAFRIENVMDDVVIIVEAKKDSATGVESGKWKVESGKVLRDGQIVIIRGDKKYSILGIQINK